MTPGTERVAVTGVGIVSALGSTAVQTFDRLVAGERGFAPVTLFDVAGQRSELGAEVASLRVADVAPRGAAFAWSRSDALAVLAARDALASAGIEPGGVRLSLAVGATTGGMFEAESALAAEAADGAGPHLISFPLSASAQRVTETVPGVDRTATVCSACSSGAGAILQAVAWLRRGDCECVLAGGTDGLCQLTFAGFNSLGATDPAGSRPFDVGRAGLTLGEGAGFLVLERESDARRRDARVLAWLSGWAAGAEAHHITHPEPTGVVPARLIRAALGRAGLAPSDVDYVNAHGTGTLHNDAMEASALCAALGPGSDRVRVSSCKGQLGHTLGAAGGIEAAVTVLALDSGRVPPTGGLEQPDGGFGLRHVTGLGERCDPRVALSNSFGFGGMDAVLVFESAASPVRAKASSRPARVVVTASASASAADSLDPVRCRRFDSLSALAATGSERVLADAGLPASGVGLALGTGFGNVDRSAQFLARLARRGPRLVSPAEFPHLLPSTAAGNTSVYLGLTGPVFSVTDIHADADAALAVAVSFIDLGLTEAMIAGAVEAPDAAAARLLDGLFADRPRQRSEVAIGVLLESAPAARARGVTPIAEVRGVAHAVGDPSEVLRRVAAPKDPARSIALHSGLASALGGSSWALAERRDATGTALVVGVRLIADSVADEVLVCTAAWGSAYATHLVRPDSI